MVAAAGGGGGGAKDLLLKVLVRLSQTQWGRISTIVLDEEDVGGVENRSPRAE